MTKVDRLKREARKLAKEHGHVMSTFQQLGGGAFQAECSECGESVQISGRGVAGGAHTTQCPGMKIETTKDDLLGLFIEQFDSCRVPRGVSLPNHLEGTLRRASAKDALRAVISCAYSAGFLWARHQCGTHPDYVIRSERKVEECPTSR